MEGLHASSRAFHEGDLVHRDDLLQYSSAHLDQHADRRVVRSVSRNHIEASTYQIELLDQEALYLRVPYTSFYRVVAANIADHRGLLISFLEVRVRYPSHQTESPE